MPKFGVSEQKENALLRRMETCRLKESDIEEKFIRSGGPGGQHVNRRATCVYLKHTLTGLEVKMQQERSQSLNRFFARRRLCELLEAELGDGKTKEQLKQDKIRKQKKRRRKRSSSKQEPIDYNEEDISSPD